MRKQWFISDLHLAIERPRTIALFEQFLAKYPRSGDHLFILGDLFDVWIGDDDDAEVANRVRAAIRATANRGVLVLIQRGNRDLIMGRRLMQETGARLLPDLHVTAVAGQPTLLMHGDLLCTDDVEYQKARRRFRNPLFQWFMLRKPLWVRRKIVSHYRRRSREAKASKPAGIMDVNRDTVVEYLNRFEVRNLIHGHTHRPAFHRVDLGDNRPASRLVLPEWHEDHVMIWFDDGQTLRPIEIGNGKADSPQMQEAAS